MKHLKKKIGTIRFLLLHNTPSVAKNQSIFSVYNKANLVLSTTPWTCTKSHKMDEFDHICLVPTATLSFAHALTLFLAMCVHTYTQTYVCTQVQHPLGCPNQVGGLLNSKSFCLQSFPIKSNNTFQNKRKKGETKGREKNQHCWMYGAWTTSFLCVETNLLHYVSISCMSTLPQGLIFTKQTHHSFPQDENMVKYLL